MRFWKPRAKRLAAMVCALALTASLLPTAVFAEPGDTVPAASSTVTAEEKTKETPAPDVTEEGQNTLSVPGEQPKEQPSPEPSESPAPEGTPTPSASPEVTAEPTESPVPSAAPTESPEPAGTPTPTPSASPEVTAEPTESPEPSAEPTESPEPVETPTTTPVLNEVQTFAANAAPDATRNAPEAKADSGEVYSYTGSSTAENIYVGFDAAESIVGSLNNKNITIEVKVDGAQVASKPFNDVYAIGSYLTIDAEMYDVSIDENGAGVSAAGENKWLVTVGVKKDWKITVNLQARTTFGDYEIDEYGTFHWSKQHASNPDFERTLYVYVNGSETPAYTTTVKTAETMSNGSSSKQYWFTPNTEKYKADYTINPAITVDTVRKDISVYLTTKCACGNDKCLCPGGCTCPSGCDCDYCTGATLKGNQIDTGCGLITYQEPGAMGGYNLTVKVYVNGQEKFVSDQFQVYMGLPGNLKFDVADGYYYHQPNGYDLDTKNDGSTWLIETSQLSIVGALKADREYDNVLSIYLWTFENYVSLDVQRMAGTSSEDVTGYQISYTLDDGVTYTYPATAIHDAAQPQTIPTGVDVTISAICPSPKIATVWECAQANDTNILLEGCAGSDNQTKAYGNSATLQVNSVNDPRVVVYVGGVQDVEKPDDTTVNTVSGESAVEVACATKPSGHEQKTYALEPGSYTLAEAISGSAVQGYTYDVTVTGTPYVKKYNDTYEDHTLSTAETDTMVLAYVQTYDADQDVVAGEWQLKEAAEFGVTCGDEPEEPEYNGTPIKIKVYLDGEDVTANYADYLNIEAGDGTTGEAAYDAATGLTFKYRYETYNCADITYKILDRKPYTEHAVAATLVYGENGSEGIAPSGTNTTALDNVQGGSTVTIYLATPYGVDYYVDGEWYSGDDNVYAKVDPACKHNMSNVPGAGSSAEQAVDENGMQRGYEVCYKTGLLTEITLASIEGLDAWYPKWVNGAVDGTKLTGATIALATILADKDDYTIDDSGSMANIQFFGVTAPENAKVEVEKTSEVKRDGYDHGQKHRQRPAGRLDPYRYLQRS